MTSTETRWRHVLLAICAVGLFVVFVSAAAIYGLGSRPFRGFWDSTVVTTGRPYVTVDFQPRPDGASAAAGIRNGDVIDLRDQSLAARYEWIYELMATQPTDLVVRRGGERFVAHVTGSTVFEGPWFFKIGGILAPQVAFLFFLGCAVLIALRQPGSRDARDIAFVLLLQMGLLLGPSLVVTPTPAVNLALLLFDAGCTLASSWILVQLASRFGIRSRQRDAIEWTAYALTGLSFARSVVSTVGIATLWIDPLPFLAPSVITSGWYPLLWAIEPVAGLLAVVVTAAAAVASVGASERTRAAWLLLPLPIAFAISSIVGLSDLFNSSWFVFSGSLVAKGLAALLGALTVTYALLKRRVLDIGFILSRTLVVAMISLIVVVAFILLEWLLGTVLSNVSHATGLAANAVLALVLGLSMRYIHQRVDTFVDAVLFHKRHEDERALLDWAKEAGYVTDLAALLDATIDKIRRHTDARGAALLVQGDAVYAAVRSFGDAGDRAVGENDEAVLALKTWHRAIDPHRYATALHGALALPMLARGRLVAILLLGERNGGEAYAPDEIEALSQFAHGVASALDNLSERRGDENADLRRIIAELAAEVRALPERLSDELNLREIPARRDAL